MKHFLRRIQAGVVVSCLPMLLHAAGVVTEPTEASLRTALAGGGTVTFACDGVIPLASTLVITNATTLDGFGHNVMLSGNNAVRVFEVRPGVHLDLLGLTVANGRTNRGAGIFNDRGVVALTNCVFAGNLAKWFDPYDTSPCGGAVWNGGVLVARGTSFLTNRALGGPGGAICNTGTLQLAFATFTRNTASGADAIGGAIYHAAGLITLDSSVLSGNMAQAGTHMGPDPLDGGNGGFAQGGALFNGGTAQITDTAILSNTASGGPGIMWRSWWVAEGGGDGMGGGLFNRGVLHLNRCTLAGNQAQGGEASEHSNMVGPYAGIGYGGALSSVSGEVLMINSTLGANQAVGGRAAHYYSPPAPRLSMGGNGVGGAAFVTNTVLRITNGTVVANIVKGGPGEAGTTNTGPTGQTLTGGIRHNGSGSFSLVNSIVAQNTAGDVFGSFDGAPNVIGGDPRLSPLADNGGPTWTMALLPDSPAIDTAIHLPGISTDQRGVARPFGAAPDIGAYEWNGTNFYSDFRVRSLTPASGQWQINVAGPTNRSFRLCVSSNLADWTDVRTSATDGRGLRECADESAAGWPTRFYRVISP